MVLFQFGVWVVGQADGKTAAGQGAISSQTETFTEVPFTVDASEVEEGTYLLGGSLGFNWFQLNGQTSGVLRLANLDERAIFVMTLGGSGEGVVAQDLIIPGFKTALTFNAETSALAEVVGAAATYGASADEQIAIYKRAKNHQRSAELVDVYRKAKGRPSVKAISERAGELEVIIASYFYGRAQGSYTRSNLRLYRAP